MRIAALVKQIPKFETMTLGPDGRLQRDGLDLEMNAYCRRAVAQAVATAAAVGRDSAVTIVTLGPPSADDCLREAIAWGTQHGLEAIDGLHVCDPAFAGSDTLATARALAAVLRANGPFDVVFCGRNSVDADTGQVGPQIAELLGCEFVSAARTLTIDADGAVSARSETDDGWADLVTQLPAVISCAERLIDPSKVEPAQRALVDTDRIRTVSANDLGPGPWGQDASPTWVGATRSIAVARDRVRHPERSVPEQVVLAVQHLADRKAFSYGASDPTTGLRDAVDITATTACIAVVTEPERSRYNSELLGAAQSLANAATSVVAFVTDAAEARSAIASGADHVVVLTGARNNADLATAITEWCREERPQSVLAASTSRGREVAGRLAAALGAGLTGDAVELHCAPVADTPGSSELVAWKPAFGGAIVAAIHCRSVPQLATVRSGVLPAPLARAVDTSTVERRTTTIHVESHHATRVVAEHRDDDLDVLADADAVIAIGRGVGPDDLESLEPLRTLLGAQIGATRKITDKGWLPRARQIGITGRSIAPHLLVSIGANGKFNHSVGFRNAATVLAINPDPDAPVFDVADVGIVASWQDAAPLLVAELERYGLSGR